MENIIFDIFQNPANAGSLIRFSNGNPQNFRNYLIDLNMSGQLAASDKEIVLPNKAKLVDFLTKDKWDLLNRNTCMSDVVLMLGFSPLPISYSNCSLYLKQLDKWTEYEKVVALDALMDSEILRQQQIDNEVFIEFSHDVLHEQIMNNAKAANSIKYLYLCEKSAMSIKEQIESELNTDLSVFFKLDYNYMENIPFEYLEKLICAARNFKLARVIGWEAFAYNTSLICSLKGYDRGAQLTGVDALEHLKTVLKKDSTVLNRLRNSLINSLYKLGDYPKAILIGEDYPPTEEMALYALALSLIIEKKERNWFDKIQTLLNQTNSYSFNVANPLIRSVLAIALREHNAVHKGEQLINEIYSEKNDLCEESWYRFLISACLYLPQPTGFIEAKEALSFHLEQKDNRSAGLTYCNIGLLMVKQQNFELAMEYFEKSELHLKVTTTADVVFPILNRAATFLMKAQYKQALKLLRSCLYRRCPEEELLTVYVNLALAEWGVGLKPEIEKLEKMLDENTNTWLGWMTAYNLAFLKLDGGIKQVDDKELNVIFNDLLESDPKRHSAMYWNKLIAGGELKHLMDKYKMIQEENLTALDTLVNIDAKAIRPIFLSFGHV